MLGLGLGLGLRPQNVGLGLEAIGLDYIVVIVKLLRTVAYVSILRIAETRMFLKCNSDL